MKWTDHLFYIILISLSLGPLLSESFLVLVEIDMRVENIDISYFVLMFISNFFLFTELNWYELKRK